MRLAFNRRHRLMASTANAFGVETGARWYGRSSSAESSQIACDAGSIIYPEHGCVTPDVRVPGHASQALSLLPLAERPARDMGGHISMKWQNRLSLGRFFEQLAGSG